jgi:spore maturation protein CgeB
LLDEKNGMRIFCAIEEEPFPGNRLWHNNIVGALRDLGHEVVLFDFPQLDDFYRHADTSIPVHRRWIAAHRPALEEALIQQIQAAHGRAPLQIFLSYFYSAHCTHATIEAIRRMGIKTVNWYCNASYQMDLVAGIAPAYDRCLVPEKERLEDYRRIGARPLYCQEAANPAFYRDLGLPRDLGVVFVGQNYATRAAFCRAVFKAGLPIDVWGNSWGGTNGDWSIPTLLRAAKVEWKAWKGAPRLTRASCHGFCTDQEMVAIYNRAKIALGFGAVASADFQKHPIYQVRLRDFEAPMCGAFYLTEHQPELAEFFEIGREIETFHTEAELVDKARYYLQHEDAREKIRQAGHERARRDHTWQKRLTWALTDLR